MTREEIEKDIEQVFGDSCGARHPFRDIIDNYEDEDIYDVMIEWAKKHGATFDNELDEKSFDSDEKINSYINKIRINFSKPEPFISELDDFPLLEKWVKNKMDFNRYETVYPYTILDSLDCALKNNIIDKEYILELIDLVPFKWDW